MLTEMLDNKDNDNYTLFIISLYMSLPIKISGEKFGLYCENIK